MSGKQKDIPATVEQGEGCVEIIFSDEIPRELIEKQVQECQSGTCQCCTPAFRENVESFEIVPDRELKVRVTGKITKEQIMENILSCAPKLGREA
ncbi:hypothetical protein GF1_29550 [Desulfolithobacter dissulfuricans]|uniref:Uncharacterized protein n=1 Tax=Desulfolithobacter dissulfuricans TaxID=2795293 RepID=A0A915XJ77_9BACT|nr:hypothetical protein [Desulfolithobacter dissulfuricans]BCO10579.1 hypothetical protein GF1_29550 [Desulfolithobacter dissulfuricans]